MKKVFFFIHIPKTAGTSFRQALSENKKINMLYDYGEDSHESNAVLVANDPAEITLENKIFHSNKYNVICGHVPYRKYAHCVSNDCVLVLLRNPIERIVSEYQHLKRHAVIDVGFAEFSSAAVQVNKQFRMLARLGGESGAVIGLTSHYKYFLDVCSSVLGLPLRSIDANRAPLSDMESRDAISAKDINTAFEYSAKEIKFYFSKAREFSRKISDAGFNTCPAPNIRWNFRTQNNNRLIGWMDCGKNDCYFLEVKVNGERRAILGLDQERADIVDKGLSESLVCGFNYPLSLLGACSGDTLQLSVLGAPKVSMSIQLD